LLIFYEVEEKCMSSVKVSLLAVTGPTVSMKCNEVALVLLAFPLLGRNFFNERQS
jgi:hypothetical protein